MTTRVDCCLDGTQISLLVRHVSHSDFSPFHGVISQCFVCFAVVRGLDFELIA